MPTNRMCVRIAYHRTYVLIPRLKISNNFTQNYDTTGILMVLTAKIQIDSFHCFYALVYLTFVISMYVNYYLFVFVFNILMKT